jgi:hypothetical protein
MVGQLTTYEDLCNCGANPAGIRVYVDEPWDDDDFWWIDLLTLRTACERLARPDLSCYFPLAECCEPDGFHYVTESGGTRLIRRRNDWEG